MLSDRANTTKTNIFKASNLLFLKRTYADVTMDQIAQKSQLTKGALYHHFTSKEDLYLAMMLNDLEMKRHLFESAIASATGCRSKLRALTEAFLSLPPQSRNTIKLVRRDINTFGEPIRSRLIDAYQAALPKLVEVILTEGIGGGEIKPVDARLLSWTFVSVVECTLGPYADATLGDPSQKLDFILDLFFNGAEL